MLKEGGVRTAMDKTFKPEKYGMLSCIECNGNGKLLNESEDIEVCPRCGGFGFIKKKEDPDKNGIASPLLIINVEEKSDV
jgi:DnaJ-class molecular chaperone